MFHPAELFWLFVAVLRRASCNRGGRDANSPSVTKLSVYLRSSRIGTPISTDIECEGTRTLSRWSCKHPVV